ncbi:MAG: hypothetical protein FJ217_15325 [Ignavibacteria bacterium]|nr:hypothetical protein [Ignavibacteria bacterium]
MNSEASAPRWLWKLASLGGAAFLAAPCYIWGVWINTFSSFSGKTQQERSEAFFSRFPAFLQNAQTLTLIALASCVLAVVLSTVSLKHSRGVFKSISVLTMVAAAFLGLFTFLTMM